jgi:hypothetical protein
VTRKDAKAAALEIVAEKYPQARVAFLAGSVNRGESTATSDLDLVVICERLPQAYRESFTLGGWPTEVFVHDPQTLRYFVNEVDRPSGVPVLATMVLEGIELPGRNEFSSALKELARANIESGPPAWSDKDIAMSRYAITNLIDDLRAPRSRTEFTAATASLYALLAEHYLRSRRLWGARGKAIPRYLSSVSAEFGATFCEAFQAAFEDGNIGKLVSLSEDVLRPNGGWLFDGHLLHAPESWRSPD